LLDLAGEIEDVRSTAALLSTNNVDKGVYGATLADRVGMLMALRESRPSLAVLASNAARIPDQAAALRSATPHTGFDFIVGYDTLVRVFEPRYYEDMDRDLAGFFAHHRLIAANRGDATFEAVLRFLDDDLVRPFAHAIIPRRLEDEPSRFSSTAARESAENGEAAPETPPEVYDYIKRHGLYRAGNEVPT
jgi:nicotinic acid mononucleotide adenylyltransferase